MMIHTVDATYEHEIEGSESDYWLLTADLSIDFTCQPGGGGRYEPAYGASVEFVGASMRMGRTWQPAPRWMAEWARDWLAGAGHDYAVQKAEDDLQPDPDSAYERKRDDQLMGLYA